MWRNELQLRRIASQQLLSSKRNNTLLSKFSSLLREIAGQHSVHPPNNPTLVISEISSPSHCVRSPVYSLYPSREEISSSHTFVVFNVRLDDVSQGIPFYTSFQEDHPNPSHGGNRTVSPSIYISGISRKHKCDRRRHIRW